MKAHASTLALLMVFLAGCTSLADTKADVTKTPLAVELATTTPVIKMGEQIKLSVTLVNRDTRELTLVQPGDGSSCGWRTPVVQWLVGGVGPRGKDARCGNINSLRPNEVITLKPGERIRLNEWIGTPSLPAPGKYKISFRYANVPELKWSGLPLGKHDPAAMIRVRDSSAVSADSNVIEIEVKEK